MNLAIRFDYGKKRFISYGHFFRILKLYNYFKKKYKFSFLIKHGDKKLFKKYFKADFIRIKKNNHEKINKYLKKNKIKFILCDINSDCQYLSKNRKSFKLIGIKDNLINFSYYNIIIFPHPYKIFKKIKNIKFYAGLKYTLLEKNFLKEKHILRKRFSNLIISMGGSDNNNLSKKIINILTKYKFKNNINLVVGPGYKKNLIKYTNKKIRIFKNLSNFEYLQLRLKADLILTTGGQSMYENLFLNIPMICFPTNIHEEKSIKFFNKKKLLIKGSDFKIKNIDFYTKYEFRKKIKRNLYNNINYNNNFFNLIQKLLKK